MLSISSTTTRVVVLAFQSDSYHADTLPSQGPDPFSSRRLEINITHFSVCLFLLARILHFTLPSFYPSSFIACQKHPLGKFFWVMVIVVPGGTELNLLALEPLLFSPWAFMHKANLPLHGQRRENITPCVELLLFI